MMQGLLGAVSQQGASAPVPGTFNIPGNAANSGRVVGFHGTYSGARNAGDGSTQIPATGDATVSCGQAYQFSFYYVYEGLLEFDLSGVVGTVDSAELTLNTTANASDTDFLVVAFPYDYGASIAADDFVEGSDILPLGPMAYYLTSGLGGLPEDQVCTNISTALKTYVQDQLTAGDPVRLLLASTRTYGGSGTAPTGNEHVTHKASACNLEVVTS